MADRSCAPAQPTPHTAQASPWTPTHHALVSAARPVRLLELTTGQHGKAARFECAEGWSRTIDLPTEADGWHPLFKDLPVEQRTRLQMHVRQPSELRPDGTRVRREGLSFCTVTASKHGKQASCCYFDVPAEDFAAGQVTGYRCAAELLASLRLGYGPQRGCVPFILREAGVATDESVSRPSRRGAAVAFLDVMANAVRFFAGHAQCEEWVAGRIEEAQHQQAHSSARRARERAEFVARMQAGRAKRHAQRL